MLNKKSSYTSLLKDYDVVKQQHITPKGANPNIKYNSFISNHNSPNNHIKQQANKCSSNVRDGNCEKAYLESGKFPANDIKKLPAQNFRQAKEASTQLLLASQYPEGDL